MIAPVTKRITTGVTGTPVTTTVIATSCVLFLIAIACAAAGTAWTLQIQDKASPPNVLIPAFTLTVPTDGKVNLLLNLEQDFPLPMNGGIDIITTGTAAGIVAVWMILGTNK